MDLTVSVDESRGQLSLETLSSHSHKPCQSDHLCARAGDIANFSRALVRECCADQAAEARPHHGLGVPASRETVSTASVMS